MSTTLTSVKHFILERVGADPSAAENGHDLALLESGLVDSFSFLELLAAIEQEYSVKIDFGGHDPQVLTMLHGLAAIVCNALPDDAPAPPEGGGTPESDTAEVALLVPGHPQWGTLAGMFDDMHREFGDMGSFLPPPEGASETWLSGVVGGSAATNAVLGAVRDNRLIGFVNAIRKILPPYLGGQLIGEIVFLYIVPDCRRGSVGTDLAKAAIRHLRANGVHSIELKVLIGNTGGKQFWQSLGFEDELCQMRLAPSVQSETNC